MRGYPRRSVPLFAAMLSAAALAGCSEGALLVHGAKRIAQGADSGPAGVYKIGSPYQINGSWYYPKLDYEYVETGVASWYGPGFHGKRTANGETFDENVASAAHRTLPLPSVVRVTNLENGRSIKLRVNDRGPFARGRIIDLSRRAAQLLGFHRQGTAKVRVEVLAEESRQLAMLYGADPGSSQLARASVSGDDDKPPVRAAPSVAVTAAPLEGAPPPAPERRSAATVARDVPPPEPSLQAAPPNADLRQMPVGPTNMYVQAGAFAEYDNANRLRARLSVLGPAEVSQVQLGQQIFFRVRLGPIRDLKTADIMLDRVLDAGHEDARLVVDR